MAIPEVVYCATTPCGASYVPKTGVGVFCDTDGVGTGVDDDDDDDDDGAAVEVEVAIVPTVLPGVVPFDLAQRIRAIAIRRPTIE